MEIALVQQIYEQLLIIGCCKNRSEFSAEWLGMNQSYYRSAMARHEIVGVRAQVHLIATLRNVGMSFARSDFDFVVAKGHIMIDLHARLLEELFDRVIADAQVTPLGWDG